MITFKKLSHKKTNRVQPKTLPELQPNQKWCSFEFTKINLLVSNLEISKKGQNFADFSFQVSIYYVLSVNISSLDVTKGSIASKKGISVGDELISINGNKADVRNSSTESQKYRNPLLLRNANYVMDHFVLF